MLLTISRLSKRFPIEGGAFRRRIGWVQALQDVSFALEAGKTLAVVGGSGSGKSTLAKIIAGLLPADAGEMTWNGEPLDREITPRRARRIQMIFQDPYASLNPKLSIGAQLAEVAQGPDVRAECVRLLETVGLSGDALRHYPFQFSGGQRQRIAIARALALRPALLIGDEPLSALDVSIQAQILELFRRLKAELGLTLLFITHDLAVAAHAAEDILVLSDGRLVEQGPTRSVLRSPQHPYTRSLLEAAPRLP